MGSESLIIMRVKSNNEYKIFCILYNEYEGYVQMMGKKIIKFFDPYWLVDGMLRGINNLYMANGPACLFARMVHYFKDGALGRCYITPHDAIDEIRVDYKYYIDFHEVNQRYSINIKINYEEAVLYNDSLDEFGDYVNNLY